MGGYDGSIRIDTRIDSKNFNSGISKMGNSLKGLAGAVGVAFGVAALIKFGKEAVTLASDLQEVQNVVDVTFGQGNKKIEEFTKNALESFGLSELAAKKYVSTLGSMGDAMGSAGTANEDMSVALTKLIGDFSSFKNISSDEAFTAISAVYTGETETLKRYGIVITDVNLQEYARQQGISKSITKMNQREKVMLRYNYILEKTALMQGDFERTSDSWANQTRVLAMRWKEFLGLMGTGLIQMLTPALKFLNTLMQGLIKFAQAFAKVTEALFGKQSLSADNAANSIGGVAGAQDEYADATNKAKKANDKFLSGLDEINKLSEKDTDSGDSPIGGISSVPDMSGGEIGGNVTISPTLQKVIDTLKGFFDGLKSIDLTPAKEALGRLWEALKPFASTVGEGLKWFWDNVLLPLGKWVMEDAVPAFLDLLSGALDFLTPIIDGAKEGLKWLWDKFLKPIAEWTGGIIISFLEGLTDKFEKLGKWLSDNQEIVENFAIIIGSFAIAWGLVTAVVAIWNLVGAIATGVTGAFGAAVAFLTSPVGLVVLAIGALIAIIVLCVKYWDEIKAAASACWDWIKGIWEGVATWFDTNIVQPIANFFSGMWESIKSIFSPVVEWFSNLFGSVWQTIKDIFHNISVIASGCWDIIKAVWAVVSSWFKDTIITPISNFFSGMWEGIKNSASNAWNSIKSVFSPVVDWFKNVFSSAWDAVMKVFQIGGKIFDGITEGILSTFKSIVNVIISGINKVVAIPFNGINKTIEAIKGINIMGISPFTALKTISVPQIPKLARGAVIPPNAEFAAILGDQRHGRNLEAPEGLIRQIVKEESGNSNLTVILQMPDGSQKQVFDTKQIAKMNRQAGKVLIPVEV